MVFFISQGLLCFFVLLRASNENYVRFANELEYRRPRASGGPRLSTRRPLLVLAIGYHGGMGDR